MTGMEYTALGVASLIFMIGLAASLLPVLPGSVIVWLGMLTHYLWLGADQSVSGKIVILCVGLTVIGLVADFVLGAWGARRFGASWQGAVGALAGALIGFFLPPPLLWLIIGPILGAFLGEIVAGKSFRDGGRAGMGTVIGGIAAFALKMGLSVCVIALFFLDLFLL